MSYAICEIWLRDGSSRIGYTNYQGSTDIIAPGIAGTPAEAWDAGGWDKRQACDHDDHVEAWAWSHYGGDDYWPITVCNKCWVITGQLSPYEPDWGYGNHSDEEREFWRNWHAEGWPKKGTPPGIALAKESHGD